MKNNLEKDWLTVERAKQELGVSAERIRQFIRTGRLEAINFNGRYAIHKNALEAVRHRKPGRPKKQ